MSQGKRALQRRIAADILEDFFVNRIFLS